MAANSRTKQIGIGLGVAAAVAAAAAGAYFLYGKNGARNRKKIKGWMLRAKGEVLERIEQLKEVNQAAYNRIVDEVASRYERLKNVNPEELKNMVQELRGHWKNITREAAPKRKPARRKATKK